MKDTVVDSIEVIEWLRFHYGEKLNPWVTSAKLCQNKTDVCWICVEYQKLTILGILKREEICNLDIIVDTPEHPAYEDDIPHYSPKRDAFDNAAEFFRDEVSLAQLTRLFKK